MSVEEIPFVFPPDPPRTGVHLSTIIKDLLRIHNPKRYGKPADANTFAAWSRGYALEDMLKSHRLWPSSLLLQQEFADDDIIHTLDGFDPIREIVYESKCTLLSAGRPITDDVFISWKWQIRCYMRVSRARLCYLDVLHLCGDWNPPQTTPPKRWRWTKEPREEDAYWSMIRRHRDRMAKKGLIPA